MEIAYHEVLRTVTGNPCPRKTITPPNRLETGNWELILALGTPRDPAVLENLRDALQEMTGGKHIFFAPSCRCAIAQILSLLPHQEVVMPAFTCPVVKTAVKMAGKRIVYVDIARNGLNATSAEFAEHARPGRVLLPTHVFGIPTDVENICDIARDRDCLTIEDAAAAFGARRNGRLLGTFADFGIYSFERSKRLPAFRGAAIIVNNDRHIDPARLNSHRLVNTTVGKPLRELAFSIAYNVATIPWIYGRFTVPKLLRNYSGIRECPAFESPEVAADTPFYNREFHSFQAALLLRMLERIDGIREHVSRIVSVYRKIFEGAPIQTFDPPNCDEGGLLRFPIIFPGRERKEILRRTLGRGLYLETNYERPLAPEAQYFRYPNTVYAANNMVLLPLYRGLSTDAAENLAREIVEIARDVSCREHTNAE